MSMIERDIEKFKLRLIEKGEEAVIEDIALGRYNEEKERLAAQWLRAQRTARTAKDREEELEIGHESNRIARDANKLSKWAIGISLLALVVSVLAILGTFWQRVP